MVDVPETGDPLPMAIIARADCRLEQGGGGGGGGGGVGGGGGGCFVGFD